MIQHILLPIEDVRNLVRESAHKAWLDEWLELVQQSVDEEQVAASVCVQACLAELALDGELRTDWSTVFDELLTGDGHPIAYSPNYVKRLYKCDNQGVQSPVHAIHARWWLSRIAGDTKTERHRFGEMILDLIQPDGWIFNPRVSETTDRYRMRSERFMNLAMGIQILEDCGTLSTYADLFAATIASQAVTFFVSAEYFRARCLEMLNKPHLQPAELESIFDVCRAGEGWADFSVADKRDEYMGTRTRVGRDVALHSPLSSLHIRHLATLQDGNTQAQTDQVLKAYGNHLSKDPLDIPAFTIRDLKDIAFATDISPIEILCAADLIQQASASNDTDLAAPGVA